MSLVLWGCVPSLLDCGTAVPEGRPRPPHCCCCYTRCLLCCIGKGRVAEHSGRVAEHSNQRRPVRRGSTGPRPRRCRGDPTHHCGQLPSPPAWGCVRRSVSRMGGADTPPARLSRPPTCTTHGCQSTPAVTRRGGRPATADPRPGLERAPARPQHRPTVRADPPRGCLPECPQLCLASPHSAIQTMMIAPCLGSSQARVAADDPAPTPPAVAPRRGLRAGVLPRTRLGGRGHQECVKEAYGRVPSARTHADSKERGGWGGVGWVGAGKKGREMATRQFDAAGCALCPPKHSAHSPRRVCGWRLHQHTHTHTNTRAQTRCATPPPPSHETAFAPTAGAASPLQTTRQGM